MTLEAYEELLDLISFTDHQGTHSHSLLLQGRDAANVSPPPACFPQLTSDGCVRTYSYTDSPLAWFTLQSSYAVAEESDSDLSGNDAHLRVSVML